MEIRVTWEKKKVDYLKNALGWEEGEGCTGTEHENH